ncbi:MAG: serine hydrolase, partial [Woeseiaceae bacterium]|nr:serine hydrolase [Woeseiaceae bacterium]
MKINKLHMITLLSCLLTNVGLSENSDRPSNLTLTNFQFGPINRWSYSHIREILPSANISHANNQILTLKKDEAFIESFNIKHDGRVQSIDQIARDWYIDGLLILKNGNILFEKYYGHLAKDKPHLMNSISKSVVGLLAGKLESEGVIDFSQTVSHYIPELSGSG